MKTPLMLCLILACAAAASAQKGDRPAPPAAPPQAAPAPAARPAESAGPTAGGAATEAPKAAAPESGPESFWKWFVGADEAPGAYRAPEMPCSLVHDLNNVNARAPKRRITDRGQTYYAPFMLSVGANPKLCMYTDGPTIPAEAMLPMSPTAFNSWIADQDKDQSVRAPMMDYIKAADDTENPVARMTADRAKFWPAALKAVLADGAFRAALCAKLEPKSASCATDIAGKSADDLYALGRKAPR